MHSSIAKITLASIALFGVVASPAGARGQEPNKLADLRQKVLSARSAEDKGNAYKVLFAAAAPTGIRDMCKDQDLSISLHSGWEHYKKVINRPMSLPNRSDAVFDRESISQFTKFAEDRLDVALPNWWREAILNGEVFPGRHHAFLDRTMPKLRFVKDVGVFVADGIELAVSDDEVVMRTKDKSVKFPVSLIPDDQGMLFTTTLGEQNWYIARYPEKGYPFLLRSMGRKDGKAVWTAHVWAVRRGASTGVGSHRVEILERKDSVYVFGRESHGMYLEGFDKRSGNCRFRFCTSYWGSPSEGWGLK
jgi:hypothetical protein